MSNFVELHQLNDEQNLILVDLEKAEIIQSHYISFHRYAINVQETYDELKKLLLKNINNKNNT